MRQRKEKIRPRNSQIQQSNCRLICNIISSSKQKRGERGRYAIEMSEGKEGGFGALVFLWGLIKREAMR